MDKSSYLLTFLIVIVGAVVIATYIDPPWSWIVCFCFGLAVSIGAVKIEKYVNINNGSSTE